MKRRIIALLLVVTVLCSATVAMATVLTRNQTLLERGTAARAESHSLPTLVVGEDGTWYPNNTVCAMGLSLRDDLGLSDKWYNIVPVDLTADGTQKVDLVASGLYYFGYATIMVADGQVTVDYQLPKGDVYLKDECLQWFTSMDEVTADFLANPVGKYAFGEPVSISEELEDQSVALLFICNHVTYAQPSAESGNEGLTRYFRNLDQWASWREYLTELVAFMDAEREERAAAAAAAAATETDLAAEAEEPVEAEDDAEATEAPVETEESAEVEQPAETEEDAEAAE